jgi:hypothetical protein
MSPHALVHLYKLAENYGENPRSKDVKHLLGKALAEHTHTPNDLHEFLDEFGTVGRHEDKNRQAEVHAFLNICPHQNV